MPTLSCEQAAVPPLSHHRAQVQAQAQRARALHVDALTLIETLHLLALCRLAVQVAHRHCPPPLPKGAGDRTRSYREESLLLIALLKTLWRLSYQAGSYQAIKLPSCVPSGMGPYLIYLFSGDDLTKRH